MRFCKRLAIFMLLWLVVPLVWAADFPTADWVNAPDPIASPYAVKGGQISMNLHQYPKSINYYLEQSAYASIMMGMMYETLLSQDPVTLEDVPGLASKWSISDDGKTFTFVIDDNAYWSDGVKITAHDVVWTYDVIIDPKNLTGQFKPNMMLFERPVALADNVVQFTAKNEHWKNLLAASGFLVLPKHAYQGLDFNKINFAFPVVSGPYQLDEIIEGIKITFKRRNDWWAKDYPGNLNKYNFDRIIFYFYADRNNAFDALKKGVLDLSVPPSMQHWLEETKGERFTKNWIVKQKVTNFNPPNLQGFAMNMRTFPFNNADVRKAMNLLLDRQRIMDSILYNQYFLHRSYFEELYDKDHPLQNPLYVKNTQEAKRLLAKAGFKANPQTGWLEKDGKRFSFKFLLRDNYLDNIINIYSEDLKNAGIELIMDKKDWAAWMKDMDDFNFQMTVAAWTSPLFRDPENMWGSKDANTPTSVNLAGVANLDADALIAEQRTIFDIEKRNDILRKLDTIIFNEHPYVLLWSLNYTRIMYWNKFGTPPTVLSKYGDDSAALIYWWYDAEAAAELERAKKNGLALPAKPYEVSFENE